MLRFANLVIFTLLLSTAASYTYTPCNPCINQASNTTLETLRLGVYGDTIDDYREVPLSNPLALRNSLIYNRPTYVYIYGWTGESLFLNRDARDAVVSALIALGNCNVMQLNWNTIASNLYDYAARSVEGVAYKLAEALDKLIADGLDLSVLNINGHSLGAQIAGLTAKSMNYTVPTIVGLDPASPGFTDPDKRLNEMDAEFVLSIHTDVGFLGIEGPSGHVDFYPNGGRNPQPGCELAGLDICSHFRSCYYYAEAVRNPTAFIGVFCNSDANFRAGLCSRNQTIVMGLTTPRAARGTVYLQTNRQPPFGRGTAGTMYQVLIFG